MYLFNCFKMKQQYTENLVFIVVQLWFTIATARILMRTSDYSIQQTFNVDQVEM